jgi:hypothetical protein
MYLASGPFVRLNKNLLRDHVHADVSRSATIARREQHSVVPKSMIGKRVIVAI